MVAAEAVPRVMARVMNDTENCILKIGLIVIVVNGGVST